jgi:hypothetical protein
MKKLLAFIFFITLNVLLIAQGNGEFLFTRLGKSLVKLDNNEDSKLRNVVGREINKKEYDLLIINGLTDLKYKKNIKVNFDSKQDLLLTLNKSEVDVHGNETLVFQNGLLNYAILVINDLKVFGFLQIGADKYNIEPISDKYYLLTQVDNEKVSKLGVECNYNSSFKKEFLNKATFNKNLSTTNLLTNYTINVLVAYTQAVLNAMGNSIQAVESLIEQARTQANTTYSNSGINITMNVVCKPQVIYSESSALQTDLNMFKGTTDNYMNEVHKLRVQYGADVCVLLVANGDLGGLADGDVSDDAQPFCVVRYDYAVSQITFAHEIGHLQGARHQRYYDD